MDYFMITSGHRVGSRWLHYLLADICNKSVSPEIDISKIVSKTKTIKNYLRNNKIPKFHGANFSDIFDNIKPNNYKIIGVVRDPRDRIVSYTFHNRYHEKTFFMEATFSSDKEALQYAIKNDEIFWLEEIQQAEIMKPNLSTLNYKVNKTNFIWTTYEWLHEDIYKQIKIILNFINAGIDDNTIKKNINKHSFQNKSGRKKGDEKRDDNWRRKGIIGDWKNWLDDEMLMKLNPAVDLYYTKIKKEQENVS